MVVLPPPLLMIWFDARGKVADNASRCKVRMILSAAPALLCPCPPLPLPLQVQQMCTFWPEALLAAEWKLLLDLTASFPKVFVSLLHQLRWAMEWLHINPRPQYPKTMCSQAARAPPHFVGYRAYVAGEACGEGLLLLEGLSKRPPPSRMAVGITGFESLRL